VLQMAAMPPYAGLDEIYHVAYLSYVRTEHRPPRMGDPAVPRYLAASISGYTAALPPWVNPSWPQIVALRHDLLPDRHLTAGDVTTFSGSNYEAQQPSLYYRLAAPLVPIRTPLFELRVWRGFSAVLAILIVVATALIAESLFGPSGVLAAALLVSLPTWLTLVMRASNDALACALIALALATSLLGARRAGGWIVEAILWAGACATKLYAWPLLVALPLVWRDQRARKTRVVTVTTAVAVSVLLTIIDLRSRTNNPLGLFAFDAPARSAAARVPIAYGEMFRVLVATAVLTSGQLGDSLRPLAILLYAGPVAALVGVALMRARASSRDMLRICAVTIAAFAIAQAFNAIGYIRLARAAGMAMPAGGKEGWYWYTLAPLLVAVILGAAVKRFPIAIAIWLTVWDVLITEGAWFHDYAGLTSPAHGSWLFRWGPLFAPFTAGLSRVAVGPLVRGLTGLRVIHLLSVAALVILIEFARGIRDPQRDHSSVAARDASPPPAAAAPVDEASR